MTPSQLTARVTVGAAALLALLVSRRRPAHRPIAALLGIPLALDILRASVRLPGDVALLAYLTWPALAGWGALRTLAGWSPRAAALLLLPTLLAVLCALPLVQRTTLVHGTHGWALVVQIAAAVAWWVSTARRDVTALCALVLAINDLLDVLGPVWVGGAWDVVQYKAAVTGAVVCALQIHALARATK